MARSIYRLPLGDQEGLSLVLDARGTYGDGAEWTLRNAGGQVLRVLTVQEALALAGEDAPSVTDATLVAADEMEADASDQAERLGGMDDNVRDLWQSAISLRAELAHDVTLA
jgi:hypothetical protein